MSKGLMGNASTVKDRSSGISLDRQRDSFWLSGLFRIGLAFINYSFYTFWSSFTKIRLSSMLQFVSRMSCIPGGRLYM